MFKTQVKALTAPEFGKFYGINVEKQNLNWESRHLGALRQVVMVTSRVCSQETHLGKNKNILSAFNQGHYFYATFLNSKVGNILASIPDDSKS